MDHYLQEYYISDRIEKLDPDFLEFEEEMIIGKDKEKVLAAIRNDLKLPNPHNSCILYVTGVTDEFDFQKGRANTVDGSPPDIDIDIEKLKRDDAIEWLVEKWGRDQVAQIATFGTFGPRSLVDRFIKVTDGNAKDVKQLKKMIPPDKYGKAASFNDALEKHPEMKREYPEFVKVAQRLDDMVAQFGVHAGGVVLSNDPIRDIMPVWRSSTAEMITQYDMHEVEELGLIKFDFLGLTTLSILDKTLSLIEKHRDEKLDLYGIEDGDERTYQILEQGMLEGVFQMDASSVAKEFFSNIRPRSISDIADISALNRPGPMQVGMDKKYIDNKLSGKAPSDLPEPVRKILKGTHYTLIYQEQVMKIVSKLAGFSLVEADDVRRAIGKKKLDVLERSHERFVEGCAERGISRSYAENLWAELRTFADYCFAGHTSIHTPHGIRTISSMVEGDAFPKIYCESDEGTIVATATQKMAYADRTAFTYTFADGSKITCTPEQRFLVEGGSIHNEKDWVTIEQALEKGLDLAVTSP